MPLRRYASAITAAAVDFDRLAEASDFFTPADIEFAAQKAAQSAFEAEYAGAIGRQAQTEDFFDAIRQTRPSLSSASLAEFHETDRARFTRS